MSNLTVRIQIFPGYLSAHRFSKGSAAGRGSGGHLAASRREQGGAANVAVLPAGCGVLRGREPDDSDQHCCLLSAVTFPPEHHEEKH